MSESRQLARQQAVTEAIAQSRALRAAWPWPRQERPVSARAIAQATSARRSLPAITPPASVRWVHWLASMYPLVNGTIIRHLRWLKEFGVGGLLLLTDGNANSEATGDSGWAFARAAKGEGLDVIVRFYGPVEHRWTDANSKAVTAYLRIGVDKIQTTNEPDLLTVEWSRPAPRENWLRVAFEYWLPHAQMINSLGAWAITPPMASGVFADRGNIAGQWQTSVNPFIWCREQGLQIIGGVHAYLLNHPWDYPYDDVNQRGTPITDEEWSFATENGRWPQAWGADSRDTINRWRAEDQNPGDDIWADDACGQVFRCYRQLLDAAGYTDAWLFSGEGWAVNMNRQDRRYPANTPPVMYRNNTRHFEWMCRFGYILGNAGWIYANGSLGGTGGWASDQHYQPGAPEANSDGHLYAVAKLRERPVELDWGGPPPEPKPEPPQPEPEPEDPMDRDWQIPPWNEAQVIEADVQAGGQYWKLTAARLAEDRMANTIWVDAPADAVVKVRNANGEVASLPPKAPPDLRDRPLWGGDELEVWIDGRPSDRVEKLHGRYWNVEGINAKHVGYVLTFRLAEAVGEPETPEEPAGEMWLTVWAEGAYRLQKRTG